MKRTLLIVFLLFAGIVSYASDNDTTKAQLRELLRQRKILSDEYYSLLEKKSGFFGNKTKNDLKASQYKLVEIIDLDNKIVSSLNRTLDYRNFEKMNMNYDLSSYEDRIRNLKVLNDTLNRKSIASDTENKQLRSDIKRMHFYFWLVFLMLIVTGIAWWRNRK